jgi:hypothetical protein
VPDRTLGTLIIVHVVGIHGVICVRNKFEKRIHDELKSLRLKFSYETEKLPYILECNYIPDFIIQLKSGKKIYIETKGHFRVEDKRKLAAIKKQYPDIDLRLVFYGMSKKNSTWAIKHKIPYSIGTIPKDWFNE